MAKQKLEKCVVIGEYTLELAEDQILVKRGPKKDLVKVKDIKNINYADDEFVSYVEYFKKCYETWIGKKFN